MPQKYAWIRDKNPEPSKLDAVPSVRRILDGLRNRGPKIYFVRIGGNSVSASASRATRPRGGGSTNKKSTPRRDSRRDTTRSRYRRGRRETIANSLFRWMSGRRGKRDYRQRRSNGGPDVGNWSRAEDFGGTDSDGDFAEEQEKEEEEKEEGKQEEEELEEEEEAGKQEEWGDEEEEEEEGGGSGWFGFLWSTLSNRTRDERQVVPERNEDRQGKEYQVMSYHDAVDENEGTVPMRDATGGWLQFCGERPDERHVVERVEEYPAVRYHDAVDENDGTALMRYICRLLGLLWMMLFWWARDARHGVPERYGGRHGREYPALRDHDAVDGRVGTALMRYIGRLGRWLGY